MAALTRRCRCRVCKTQTHPSRPLTVSPPLRPSLSLHHSTIALVILALGHFVSGVPSILSATGECALVCIIVHLRLMKYGYYPARLNAVNTYLVAEGGWWAAVLFTLAISFVTQAATSFHVATAPLSVGCGAEGKPRTFHLPVIKPPSLILWVTCCFLLVAFLAVPWQGVAIRWPFAGTQIDASTRLAARAAQAAESAEIFEAVVKNLTDGDTSLATEAYLQSLDRLVNVSEAVANVSASLADGWFQLSHWGDNSSSLGGDSAVAHENALMPR